MVQTSGSVHIVLVFAYLVRNRQNFRGEQQQETQQIQSGVFVQMRAQDRERLREQWFIRTPSRIAYTMVAPQSLHAGDLFDSGAPLVGATGAAFGVV